MNLYPAILLAAGAAILAGCAQGPGLSASESAIALRDRLSHTCKNPNPGNIFREPDGGYHESFQGWFYKAEVHQGSGWALAYQNECSVSGATVNCSHPIVIKP